ncbi:MAG: DUF4105 domain-containing protein [Planctomycetales bacterium]|nr:DUF4105 domain-containing protein [Planctomycetales bacterium]
MTLAMRTGSAGLGWSFCVCYLQWMFLHRRHRIEPGNCLAHCFVCYWLLALGGCGAVTSRDDGSGLGNSNQPISKLVGFAQISGQGKQPSHARLWRADLAVLPYAIIENDRVHLHNIRDCEYRTEDDYDVRHFSREVLLSEVRSIDFIVVPFKNAPAIAHTMLSFGLANGEYLVFSVEARLEEGEQYAALASANKQFELMWVVGTERDLIRLRTDVRNVDVYLYPTRATPAQAQDVFLAAVARVNEIARSPEFYDLLDNNCTTNIVDMINRLKPGAIPQDIRIVLPGHSDRLAYDLGLLAAQGPFEQVKASSRINLAAQLNANSPRFSQLIRQQ